ncbi:hypothetical protein PV02_12285 [Methanolobus chelungpuianus]|uniref:Uncharacterized protein n=1 Tax=Methanolobus chelungpuianus TaxID=502115 RepID=A0AAE3KYN8_9EURY|nr:hypothetical protein [Methanolobus chelungpuianus]
MMFPDSRLPDNRASGEDGGQERAGSKKECSKCRYQGRDADALFCKPCGVNSGYLKNLVCDLPENMLMMIIIIPAPWNTYK